MPTAQTSLVPAAATPSRILLMLEVTWGLGVGVWVQLVPSQCAAQVACLEPLVPVNPTAQTSDGPSAVTAVGPLACETASGIVVTLQLAPFQCHARNLVPVPVDSLPT